MWPISVNEKYGRTLRVSGDKPNHMRPPLFFTAFARAQSSIISPQMAAIPPARSSAHGRMSMQPPAAPAVLRRGFEIHRGGYSLKKKKTKAGINNFSAKLSQRSEEHTSEL